jgi:hypothetical protein
MTNEDQAMLVIYQNNPREVAEELLDRYFGRFTYEEQLDLLRKELSCPETISPPSSSPSSGAL